MKTIRAHIIFPFIAFSLLLAFLAQGQIAGASGISVSFDSALTTRLINLGYSRLSRDPLHYNWAKSIFSETEMPLQLERLVGDTTAPLKARFIAAEILFRNDLGRFYHSGEKNLAKIYIAALLNNDSGLMSDWAFNTAPNEMGTLGSRLVILQNESKSLLPELLSNETQVYFVSIYPEQSRLVFCEDCNYRVKDFAALFLFKIHRIEFTFTRDKVQRDQEISRLESVLSKIK